MDYKHRKVLEQIAPYVPGKPIEEVQKELNLDKVIKLASNENPLGCSPLASEAIKETISKVAFYPDSNFTNLRDKLSRKLNLSPKQFFFGAGSDGIIEMIPKVFIDLGDEVIMSTPSFPLYKTNTILANGKCIEINLNDDYYFDLDNMLKAVTDKTKLIWLCNPNNPTGTMYTAKQQSDFISQIPKNILIVIDEAYYEYVTNENYPESVELLENYDNIIILRTFSKIYGLASLRVGYAISTPETINLLEKVRSPFNVSTFAQAAAIASLDDNDFKELSYNVNKDNKHYLYSCFEKLDLQYLISETNFIMVNVKKDAKEIFERLLHKGIIVRPGNGYGMSTWIRVTIGTKEECEMFVQALEQTL